MNDLFFSRQWPVLTRGLAILGMGILLTSCHESVTRCDRYYLARHTGGNNVINDNFYYNDEGRISVITGDPNDKQHQGRIEFNYKNGILDNTHDGTITTRYTFEGGKLAATNRKLDTGEWFDSMVFTYNAEGQIQKREIYNTISGRATFHSYFQVEYPYPDTITVSFYRFQLDAGETHLVRYGTFKYSMDDQRRPFPEEYNALWLSWSNTLLPHNETSLRVTSINAAPSFSTTHYEYNEQGYPTNASSSGGSDQYFYVCEPPREP